MTDIKKLIEKQEKIKKELELYYQQKIEAFKEDDIEKYNPYQATKLPSKKILVPFMDKVRDKVRDKVSDQVRYQVWDQVWDQVGDQVGDQVSYQAWDQVWDQVSYQVRDQVWDQVRDQVRATSYWGVKIALDLPVKHWFFDFLKLGVMIIFVKDKVKIFGKKGMYLGEYDESEI